MSKSMKIIISLVITLLLAFAAGVFYISSQINPDEIKTLAIENIEKGLPHANVDIDKIDYSIGTSIKLSVQKISLKLKKNDKPLLMLNEVSLHIPLLAIVTGGGQSMY